MDKKAMSEAHVDQTNLPTAEWRRKAWLKCRLWDTIANKFCTTGIYFNNSTMQLESIPSVIVQLYTDKKDHCGVLICEGDIVKCIEMHGSNVWDAWQGQEHTAKHFVIMRDTDGWLFPSDLSYHPDWWLIIGNVKENPELLKVM